MIRNEILVLPLVVEDFVRRKRDQKRDQPVFFVQIGAHDGVHYDPLYPFIRKFNWSGLRVEPHPEAFLLLQKNGAPNQIFENAAIGKEDGTVTFYTFEAGHDLPADASMFSSISPGTVESNTFGYQAPVRKLEVPLLTPSTLLKKHGIKEFDFLQIDTEGNDFDILCVFDFETWHPSIINFESALMTLDQRRILFSRLEAKGYRLFNEGNDTIAYRQSLDCLPVGYEDDGREENGREQA